VRQVKEARRKVKEVQTAKEKAAVAEKEKQVRAAETMPAPKVSWRFSECIPC
jgi:hypothetical protein